MRSKQACYNGIRGFNTETMQDVTHELFRGREDPFNLRLESCFHVPTSLNICSGSQVECGSSVECTLLLLAASTKERKTPRNPGVRCGLILRASVRHAARDEVLKGGLIYCYGTLRWRPNTDYALSKFNLGHNFVKNPAHYKLGVRTTFLAETPADYLGRRVQSKGSEGPSIVARRESDQDGGNGGTEPCWKT